MRQCRPCQSSNGQHCRSSRVKSLMKFMKHDRRWRRSCIECSGSLAGEFALVAPVMILLAAGIADFGMLTTNSTALTATTRIGAEYAKARPTDVVGIQNSMQNSMSFVPALIFPASFPQSCECDDGTSITCGGSCATAGRPGPNRVFIAISASQAFNPLVPWPGIPGTLTATTKIRLQ